MKNALCLILQTPINKEYLDFINKIETYTIYIVIEDNIYNIYNCLDLKTQYPTISFIQIPDSVCEHAGFKNLTNKVISGWDKAIYYFTSVCDTCDTYDNVWFLEDNVFFYSENTLLRLDNQYLTEDILSEDYELSYNTKMGILRLSKKILKLVEKYVSKHRQMYFLELFFPTLVTKNNLKITIPSEFYRVNCETNMMYMTKNGLYYPEKDISLHKVLRDYLDSP